MKWNQYQAKLNFNLILLKPAAAEDDVRNAEADAV
jgi:hypothetical protein